MNKDEMSRNQNGKSDRWGMDITLHPSADLRLKAPYQQTVAGFSSMDRMKERLPSLVKHLIKKHGLKDKLYSLEVVFRKYDLCTNKDEYLDSEEVLLLYENDTVRFISDDEKYPCGVPVELDEQLCGRKSAILLLHNEAERAELEQEISNSLGYIKEFDTLRGESIDSHWIKNIIGG